MRFEKKYLIDYKKYVTLKNLLSDCMQLDENHIKGGYLVHNIYFDSIANRDYYQGISGMQIRKKIRIRYYNNEIKQSQFEYKKKVNNQILKSTYPLKFELLLKILEYEDFTVTKNEMPKKIYTKLTQEAVKPKVYIEYRREAFILPYHNIRVTFDHQLKGNKLTSPIDLENNILQVIDLEDKIILEIKYTNFLPNFIKSILRTQNLTQVSISKYIVTRQYLRSR